ncbi:MAG: hypothetical protein AVDCRST_MAG02-2791 [uncultured Rubrobacteraceae bacterium]|uniref:Uncharacterized protein n=1 Tax=uncultured Rubrobacteraceae bacterium TaxID=349277 RepID=A0A6J4R409_9ACTN|nr:MAG: hypothetical protein AVDCRST_MAG02-2791 [uncultured Rubrobacteraceae bacterium]
MSGNRRDGFERAVWHGLIAGIVAALLGKRRSYEELRSLVRGFKVAAFYVALPGFLLGSLMTFSSLDGGGLGGLLVGVPLAFFSFFALAFLLPNYYLLRGDLRKRERAMGTARKIAEGRPVDHTDRRTSGAFVRHVGGGIYLHRDGTYRDGRWNEIPDDDPRVRERLDEW